MHKRGVIMSISESCRARVLEKLRVNRRLTSLRAVKMVPTAKLVCFKSLTPTLTPNNVTPGCTVSQCYWTRGQQIRATPNHRTHTFPFVRRNRHGDVKTVYQTNAVRREVVRTVVDAELSQSRRRHAAGTLALDTAAAVAGGAVELVVGVTASGSGPDPTRPVFVGYGYLHVG